MPSNRPIAQFRYVRTAGTRSQQLDASAGTECEKLALPPPPATSTAEVRDKALDVLEHSPLAGRRREEEVKSGKIGRDKKQERKRRKAI